MNINAPAASPAFDYAFAATPSLFPESIGNRDYWLNAEAGTSSPSAPTPAAPPHRPDAPEPDRDRLAEQLAYLQAQQALRTVRTAQYTHPDAYRAQLQWLIESM